MSKGMPSLLALLGLAAVAGYQNRDKLRDMIGDAQSGGATRLPGQPAQAGAGGLLEEIGQVFGSESSGRNLSQGLSELVERFRTGGQRDKADSWVSKEPNHDLQPEELERAIGADTLDALAQKVGLSRAEIVRRLTAAIPQTVDRFTPDGRLPSEIEAQRLI